MKNHIVLLLVLSLVSINSVIIGSQEAEEIRTQIDPQELTLNDTDIAWLFSEHNPANSTNAHIDSYTDAQPNDGYGSDYHSSQQSQDMPYAQWLARVIAHNQHNSRGRRRPRVVSGSDSDSDNEVYTNGRNQRRRVVSPEPYDALHRTYHAGGDHN